MPGERIVVIGGAGFIGKRLTSMLAEGGCHVVVVSRSAGARRSTSPRVEYCFGSVSDKERMWQIVAGASVVYDLSLGGGPQWEDYEREVIGGATNVARACLEHGVRRLIYTSTTAALYLGARGSVTEERLGNEAGRSDRGMYSRGKSLSENVLMKLHRNEKLPVVIFRPAVVLGSGGMMVHAALGDRVNDICILGWGRGRTPLPCVLVDDVARALLLAKDTPGIDGLAFNLAGDVRPTAAEYVAAMRERTLRNFRFYPRSILRIYGGELSRYLIKEIARKPGNSKVGYRDFKSGALVTQLECSLAKQKLGWQPVSNREEFFRQALDVFVKPIAPGDIRLEAPDE